jgi:hypothetical protein
MSEWFSPKGWAENSFFHEAAIWRDPKEVTKEVKKICKIV